MAGVKDSQDYTAAQVRLLSDGFTLTSWADCESVQTTTEIHTLDHLELIDTYLVLCT